MQASGQVSLSPGCKRSSSLPDITKNTNPQADQSQINNKQNLVGSQYSGSIDSHSEDSDINESIDVDEMFDEITSKNKSHRTVMADSKIKSNNFKPESYDEFASEITSKGSNTRPRPSSCIFVASLAIAKDEDELDVALYDLFSRWGEPCVKVLRDKEQRPYSFVQLEDDAQARQALIEAQGCLIFDRPIRCEPARINRTIFIRNRMNVDLSFESVMGMTENFGEIENTIPINLSLDKLNSTDLNGYECPGWFVQFAYRDEAICAYLHLLSKASVEVKWVQNVVTPSEQPQMSTVDKFSIYVGNLPPGTAEQMLSKKFSVYGKIKRLNLIQKSMSPFAFITFSDHLSAARAVERENHSSFMKKVLHVQYKEIHPRKPTSFGGFARQPKVVLAHPPVGFNPGPKKADIIQQPNFEFKKNLKPKDYSSMEYVVFNHESFNKPLKAFKPSMFKRKFQSNNSLLSTRSNNSSFHGGKTSTYSGSNNDESTVTDSTDSSSKYDKEFGNVFVPRMMPIPNSGSYYPYPSSYKNMGPPKSSNYYNYSPFHFYCPDGMGYIHPPPPPPPLSGGPQSPYSFYQGNPYLQLPYVPQPPMNDGKSGYFANQIDPETANNR